MAGHGGAFRTALATLASHWLRHPFQLLAVLTGLAGATALWSGVQALNAEARASYAEAAAFLGAADLAALLPAPGALVSRADHAALRRAGWQVSPVIEGDFIHQGRRLRIVGIDVLTLPPEAGLGAALTDGTAGPAPGAAMPSGGIPDAAAFLAPPWQAVADATTLPRLSPPLPPSVAGLVPPGTVLMDIAPAARLLDMDGYSRLILAPRQRDGLPPVAGLTQGRLSEVRGQGGSDIAQLTDAFHLNLTAFGFLSFVVGLFIVHAMIGLAFAQRRPMLRALRACGLPASGLALALVAEVVLLALAGGAAGMLLGYLVAAALLPDVAASLDGLYGAAVADRLSLRPAWWLGGMGMCLCGAVAAAALSLWQAARLPVLDSARPEAWHRQTRRVLRWQGLAALALAVAALALAAAGSGLVAGFALIGTVLTAAALALPLALAGALRLGAHLSARLAPGPVADWFFADARQQSGAMALALMALMLALAVNTGVGTMVGSFRLTFLDWLDQRLASDLYVAVRDEDEGARLMASLDGDTRVEAVLPIWSTDLRSEGWPLSLYGVRDLPYYRTGFPLLSAVPGAWDRIFGGTGVLVSEQFARRMDLAPGDAVDLPSPSGQRAFDVAGIYADYGNPGLQAIVALPVLQAGWTRIDRSRFGVRVRPGTAAEVRATLTGPAGQGPKSGLGLDPGQVTDQARLKEISRDVFEQTFAVTLALNALTLLVAGIAMLASLLSLAGPRLPQLAPLWALGLTRARLARLEVARALALALLTGIAAIPLGLLLAWILTAVINVEAFGWRVPLTVFPARWAALVATGLATALLAAALPAIRLWRMPPDRLLRLFAVER
jgi:putative ABC transport system permease protein